MATNREYEEVKRRAAREYTYAELLKLWPEDMVIKFKGKRK